MKKQICAVLMTGVFVMPAQGMMKWGGNGDHVQKQLLPKIHVFELPERGQEEPKCSMPLEQQKLESQNKKKVHRVVVQAIKDKRGIINRIVNEAFMKGGITNSRDLRLMRNKVKHEIDNSVTRALAGEYDEEIKELIRDKDKRFISVMRKMHNKYERDNLECDLLFLARTTMAALKMDQAKDDEQN